jgi:hypothetical protein
VAEDLFPGRLAQRAGELVLAAGGPEAELPARSSFPMWLVCMGRLSFTQSGVWVLQGVKCETKPQWLMFLEPTSGQAHFLAKS